MPNEYRVVGVTPAGRTRYLRILAPYLLQQRDRIHEHRFWINTVEPEDVSYIHRLCTEYPDFFKCQEAKIPVNGRHSIGHFFEACQDKDTIYIRFDDDICWVDKDAVENLLAHRLAHREPFLMFGNVVNNAICAYLHQRMGALPLSLGNPKYDALDKLGWLHARFAQRQHETFLEKLQHGRTKDYLFDRWILREFERFSINFFAWFGADFAEFEGRVEGEEEEEWLTMVKPKQLNRPSMICGSALVTHFAFYTQREHLESKTQLLQAYERLAPAWTTPSASAQRAK